MAVTLTRDLLEKHPGLSDWLAKESWTSDFDKASLSRGRALHRAKSFSRIEAFESRAPAHELALFSAKVQGTWIYTVTLNCQNLGSLKRPDWVVTTECSCPVNYECKHAAAVLQELTVISNKPVDCSYGPLFGGESEEPLTHDVKLWLNHLSQSQQKDQQGQSKGTESKFLSYCIEDSYGIDAVLSLRPGTWHADGKFKITQSDAKTSTTSFPKYFARQDYLPVAQYHLLRKSNWEAPYIQGEQWAEILLSALERGVLFHNFTESRHNYRRVTAGEPITAQPDWENQPNGQSRPILKFEGDPPLILATSPPLYLDTKKNTCGEIHSSMPVGLIKTWMNGPIIATEQLSRVSQQLNVISPKRELPLPTTIETVALPPSTKPEPTLHIKVARLGPKWHPFETLVAEVSVQYGDSPPLRPLKPNEKTAFQWFAKNTNFTVDRVRKQERALITQLTELGLFKITKIFPRQEIPKDYLDAYIVEEAIPTVEIAWIEFLAHAESVLKASGWTVLIDEECGIQVDEISDFVSTLEEPADHGIDWFQFDLSADLDGQKISLIPFIAQAIAEDLTNLPPEELPPFLYLPHPEKESGFVKLETSSFLDVCRAVEHLFQGRQHDADGPVKLDRLGAADIANRLALDDTATLRALAKLGKTLATITELPATPIPKKLKADLRPYQTEGFRWLHFLASHQLNGILADDMGLGKTVQTLAFLATLPTTKKAKPSLIVAPTSVITNWAAEIEKFTPHLRALLLQGSDRADNFAQIPGANLVLTSYPLLNRDSEVLLAQEWQAVILDEAQAIKNPKTLAAVVACKLKSEHRFCLSGTPMENHLGELWSLMHFVMPGFLGDQKSFTSHIRRPIERDRDTDVQRSLSRRVAPLILRRTKDEVAQDLPPKTEILHSVTLSKKESDLYESVRATMDKRVREALAAKGLAKSHIIILDALLKLRQICCHPQLLKYPAAQKIAEGSKMNFLTKELLPELFEEKRRILLFSQFTSVLSRIEDHFIKEKITYLKLTGQTKDRATLVKTFQNEDIPIFLISLKAGGTGLNLTAADTVIHYDPWWNPAAENQATDRAHRIGQMKPVFVHKLICRGSIEERILELQRHKANLVKSLLSEETSRLKIDSTTLSHLLAPLY